MYGWRGNSTHGLYVHRETGSYHHQQQQQHPMAGSGVGGIWLSIAPAYGNGDGYTKQAAFSENLHTTALLVGNASRSFGRSFVGSRNGIGWLYVLLDSDAVSAPRRHWL